MENRREFLCKSGRALTMAAVAKPDVASRFGQRFGAG